MPDFQYTARNQSGQQVTGLIAAGSEREAASMLVGQALFPVKVATAKDKSSRSFRFGRRISGQLLATTYGQLSALLRSGVPLLRSLSLLKQQTSNASLEEVLEDLHSRVEDGATLGEAMERHDRVFHDVAISMVHAGSEGGFLEDALDRIARFTEEQEELKSRTVGALAYPVFLLVFGTIIVTVLVVFFVPTFAEMFDRLRERGELPWPTEALLWLSETVRDYGLVILIALIILGVMLQRQLVTEQGKRFVDRFKLRLPIFGSVFQGLAIARICRVLGTLLVNGVPILRGLEISRHAAGNRPLADVLEEAGENVSTGDPLATPLARSPLFPREIVEMISVAEESNTLETVLVDIADRLERATARRLDIAVRLLEPVLLVILAGIVMLVVLALLLPIIKMSNSL